MNDLKTLEKNYSQAIDELELLISQYPTLGGEELMIALRLLATEVERLREALREAGLSSPIQYEAGKQIAKGNTLH